jgi:hypothetical protein
VLDMNSEKIAGLLAGFVAAIVLAVAFYYTGGQHNAPLKAPVKMEAPQVPVAPPATKGPVVREIPQ